MSQRGGAQRSTLFNGFLEQQSVFCAVLANDRKSWHFMPQNCDISVLETVRDVLGQLHDYTDTLSGEKQVTTTCIQPVQWKILIFLPLRPLTAV